MYDVWRINLGPDPPANVPPLRIKLTEGAKPYRCKPRKYPPHLRRFLQDFNEELVRLGWVFENPNSRWACPAVPVKKPGSAEYRQTNAYRPVNAMTEPLAGLMPILQLITEHVRGMKHFGLFDFIRGFWQLPLEEACREILSYMTDQKIYTPTRVPQGCSDAALYFQRTMEDCFRKLLYKHLLVWVDDLLLFAADTETYLEKLHELLELMDFFGLKLSAKKTSLYQTTVKWCGKLISGDGVRHDPERIETLKQVPPPTTAGELQQFLCATGWMRDSIVDYARTARPLQQLLDAALESKKKTKRIAAGISLVMNEKELQASNDLKGSLCNAAILAHPNDEATICLFTDASDVGWGAIVTQVKDWDEDSSIPDQSHELLTCMGGTFSGAQLNWSVIEKE
eukprot:jgi/Phyca11/128315/e_gw1.75.173.1